MRRPPGRDPRAPSAAAPAPGGCWAPAAQLFIAPGVTWGAVTGGRPDSQRLPHLLPKDSAPAGQTKARPAEEEEGGRVGPPRIRLPSPLCILLGRCRRATGLEDPSQISSFAWIY